MTTAVHLHAFRKERLLPRWDRIAITAGCVAFHVAWISAVATCAARAAERCEPPRVVAQFRCDFPRVVDPDTLSCSSGERVRLWGIDGPERGRPGAEEATRALAEITRERIECRMTYRGKYRRAVAMCYNSKGDLGRQLMSAAPVKDYTRYSGGYYGAKCWGGWR